MPLNRIGKPKDVLQLMHELPEDEQCIYDGEGYYTTKVQMYDRKCSGCGFAYITTKSSEGIERAFNKIEQALTFNTSNYPIIRSCEYPHDITNDRRGERLPSISEIISNGCQFWAIEHMNIPSDEDTSFIEIEDVSELKIEVISVGTERVPELISL